MDNPVIAISHIQARSLVDGPGERTVLFMQGCNIGCKGCQSKHLWDMSKGRFVPVLDLAVTLLHLLQKTNNITISGGEPFNQPIALAYLVRELAKHNCHIIIYSGYTWETLMHPVNAQSIWVREVLDRINILVDGPFIKDLDDPMIIYRGSRNQRPIDVQVSIKAEKPVVLDWDSPEVIIDQKGNLSLPIGLASDFGGIGEIGRSRMCGQSK